jgi:predicted KAP-like P-loop ATPase
MASRCGIKLGIYPTSCFFHNDVTAQNISIGSDAPQTDPAQDAFGYAPFSKIIADAVQKTSSPQGLVIAIHGVWGSGKSSLLNFVKYYLEQFPKHERPIVIDFNPWWFKDRDDLAAQFLALFRKKLVGESENIRRIGNLLAEYSGSIGKVISSSYGIPWLDKPLQFVLKLLKKVDNDVPTLKKELSKLLGESGQRFVFVIDDIDRLAPDEICEIFKVIKALADFPNVIYLLSFDRKVVADALNVSLRVDGDAYIEKIVQVPFSLPAVDPIRLRQKLFQELDKILETYPLQNFDQTYWSNVYFDGLDHYIKKPRDIVRVTNSLSVLYPAVVGEINPVDFIALEFLRVFDPEVHGLIWMNKALFTGLNATSYQQDLEPEKAFHGVWLDKVPDSRRSNVKNLVKRLFPRLESIWGNTFYNNISSWRREMRVCTPEYFDVNFQFGVAPESLRRAELDELIFAAAQQPKSAAKVLKAASLIKQSSGMTKAREYLERLRDLESEISPDAAIGLISALFDEGDELLSPEDEQGGFTAIPNRWRLQWTINHLLERVPEETRPNLLLEMANAGRAVGLIVDIVSSIDRYLEKPDENRDKPLAKFGKDIAEKLHSVVLKRLNELDDFKLIAIPDLDNVIFDWIRWSNKETVALRIQSIIDDDSYLPLFLEKYLHFGTQASMGDRVSRRIPRLNPKRVEDLTDIYVLESRVKVMLSRTDLTDNQRTAGDQYLINIGRIREGKNPDGLFFDD